MWKVTFLVAFSVGVMAATANAQARRPERSANPATTKAMTVVSPFAGKWTYRSYHYVGYLAWEWPNGIAQVPAIVGTVVRTKPHGPAQAGYVASFIATKHP